MVTAMCVAVANYIIEKVNEFNKGKKYSDQISMTCKRLQKLLYFSEVEYMKRHNGAPMFSDDFYAWPSGPVIPSVYYKFSQYQNGEMTPIAGEHASITFDMIKVIDYVLEKTKDKDTVDLVEFSHVKDGPWSQAYNDKDPEHEQIVLKKDMRTFYADKDIFGKKIIQQA